MSDNKLFDGTNPWATHASIDNVPFDEYGAAAVWRLMVKLGARPDTTRLYLNSLGQLRVWSKFFYGGTDLVPNGKGGMEFVDVDRIGDQLQTLEQWLLKHVRLQSLLMRKDQKKAALLKKAMEALEEAI